MDRGFLRSFILSVVKPLKSGKIVDQDSTNAGMDNLVPDGGYSKNFRLTLPFGMSSLIPKGVTGFYQGLFGSGFESIILGLLHAKRPIPSAVGEVILYSTDASGAVIKTKITMTNDGKLNINTPSDVNVQSSGAVLVNSAGDVTIETAGKVTVQATGDVDVNCANANIIASAKAVIDGSEIDLGTGTLEKMIMGETFMTFFNDHQHIGNLGYPTGAPITPMDASELSDHVKLKK